MRLLTPAIGGALLIGSVLAAPAAADEAKHLYEREAAESAGSLAPDDVSDEQLEAFLHARNELASIRLRNANEIASRGAHAKAEGKEEMAATVERYGLEIQEYRRIAHLAARHGSLAKRLDRIAASAGIER